MKAQAVSCALVASLLVLCACLGSAQAAARSGELLLPSTVRMQLGSGSSAASSGAGLGLYLQNGARCTCSNLSPSTSPPRAPLHLDARPNWVASSRAGQLAAPRRRDCHARRHARPTRTLCASCPPPTSPASSTHKEAEDAGAELRVVVVGVVRGRRLVSACGARPCRLLAMCSAGETRRSEGSRCQRGLVDPLGQPHTSLSTRHRMPRLCPSHMQPPRQRPRSPSRQLLRARSASRHQWPERQQRVPRQLLCACSACRHQRRPARRHGPGRAMPRHPGRARPAQPSSGGARRSAADVERLAGLRRRGVERAVQPRPNWVLGEPAAAAATQA